MTLCFLKTCPHKVGVRQIRPQQIVQILCSHIRSKTNEVAYQETHEEHPSNEIQTTLNLLFKEKEHGLYAQDFAKVTEFLIN
jgi:hypothetical protein